MASKNKLLIIPCAGHETAALAKEIFHILKKDYNLDDQVEFLDSSQRKEITSDTKKDHRHPLVTDYFPDLEVQVDIGRNDLKDLIRGKHIAIVEHLLTPHRNISVNDHIMSVRGLIDIIKKTETPKITLVAPYLSYVRSHSIEKYEARGFYQFDSLRKTLQDYQRDGLNSILTIDPHSDKAEQIAKQLGMEYHWVNPFQSARAINPAKLGLSDQKADEVIRKLRPYQERFDALKRENPNHLYCVSLDSGTEKRTENFIERAFPELPPAEVYTKLIYADKDRISYENGVANFKPFSNQTIDPQGTYIEIDDMFASGDTSNKIAKMLKERGAKQVENWVSHPVTTAEQFPKAKDRSYLDKVVALDTVPQTKELNIETIHASAHLLAAELYKDHQRLSSAV